MGVQALQSIQHKVTPSPQLHAAWQSRTVQLVGGVTAEEYDSEQDLIAQVQRLPIPGPLWHRLEAGTTSLPASRSLYWHRRQRSQPGVSTCLWVRPAEKPS